MRYSKIHGKKMPFWFYTYNKKEKLFSYFQNKKNLNFYGEKKEKINKKIIDLFFILVIIDF